MPHLLCVLLAAANVFTAANTEVVALPDAGANAACSARMLARRLGEVLGVPVPVSPSFTPGRLSIAVGTNDFDGVCGIDVRKVRRDGFVIASVPGRVYLLGCDDTRTNMDVILRQGGYNGYFEHSSYNAALGFLERFCGCRFYFPGELGTIVPKADGISVPLGTITDEPRFDMRWWSYWAMGEWFGGDVTDFDRKRGWTEMRMNLRMDTDHMPVAHGQAQLSYPERFRKTHPEYFCQLADGTRLWGSANAPGATYRASQFCYTSGVWEELYRDARSFFLGEDASVRGVVAKSGKGYAWNQVGALSRRWFDIMPQDGLIQCQCANCRRAFADKDYFWARDVIWSNTVVIAKRLKAEGIKGTLAQMAYSVYRDLPDMDFPDNIEVMLAERGPWAMGDPKQLESELKEIDAWSKKLHANLTLWNYAGKFPCFQLNIPDIPQCAPRSIAAYYRIVKDKIKGAYLETLTDRFLHDYLSYYVLSRVLWDPDADVEEILAEHDRLMFGAGATEMGRVFRIFEDRWVKDIACNTQDTPRGPATVPPTQLDLWTRIYSSARLDELDALFAAAKGKTAEGSLERRRVELMEKELYLPFARTGRDYQRKIDVKAGLAWNRAHPDANLIVDDPKAWFRGNTFLDDTVFLTPPHALRLTETNGVACYVMTKKGPQLKPNTRYRVSYMVKLEGAMPKARTGGVMSSFMTDSSRKDGTFRFPTVGQGPNGTRDWIRQEYEVRTYDGPFPCKGQGLSVYLNCCTGTAWIDEVRVEEIGPCEPKPLTKGE